jgi:hypothetical protein
MKREGLEAMGREQVKSSTAIITEIPLLLLEGNLVPLYPKLM